MCDYFCVIAYRPNPYFLSTVYVIKLIIYLTLCRSPEAVTNGESSIPKQFYHSQFENSNPYLIVDLGVSTVIWGSRIIPRYDYFCQDRFLDISVRYINLLPSETLYVIN